MAKEVSPHLSNPLLVFRILLWDILTPTHSPSRYFFTSLQRPLEHGFAMAVAALSWRRGAHSQMPPTFLIIILFPLGESPSPAFQGILVQPSVVVSHSPL